MYYGFNLSFEKDVPEQVLLYRECDFQKELRDLVEQVIINEDVSIIYKHADIIKKWFPENGYHIFISHSHKDVNLAKYIANKLYACYGIKSFIDSEFWGCVDEIISDINHKHFTCGDDNDQLSYEPCMRVASNFYLILADALLDAIRLSDSCWFLNTSNSIHCNESLEEATYSPWIYSELKYTSVIKKSWHPYRPQVATEARRNVAASIKKISESKNVNVEYIVPLDHLIPVDCHTMERILKKQINSIGSTRSLDKHSHFYWLNSIYNEIIR